MGAHLAPTGFDGAVVVEVVGWVEGSEGRGGGDVGQREAGRTCWVVVQNTSGLEAEVEGLVVDDVSAWAEDSVGR